VLYMLDRMGVDTGVALEPLIETSRWVQEQLGRPVPGMLVKSGTFPHKQQQTRNG
jgi:hydroxymethylglutaryl-CoA lyase